MGFFLQLSTQFKMFSHEHYIPFILAFVLLVFVCKITYNKSLEFKKTVGFTLSVLSFSSMIVYTIYNYYFGCGSNWNLFLIKGLPLWLCNYIPIAALFAFTRLNSIGFSYTFFMGISGNLIASITPELHVGFPDPEYIIFFIMHGLNLVIPIYMVVAFQYIPKLKDVRSYVISGILIMIFSHVLNMLLGSNYNYTMNTPSTSSMLDNFGEWPYYILIAVGVGILFAFMIHIVMNQFKEKEN